MKKPTPETLTRIALIILFLGCLADMPYGYFQIVRTVGMVAFIYLGYQAQQRKEELWQYFYWGSAFFINPIIKMPLGRELWNVVDVVWVVLIVVNHIGLRNQKNSG